MTRRNGALIAVAAFVLGYEALHGLAPWDWLHHECSIKGEIDPGGARVYRLPGDPGYAQTQIDLMTGERWFCSEAAAREAGWRRTR